MEIDLSSIIIGIIALSFFFVPIIYFEYYKKRATKKFTAHFNQVAQKNSLDLSEYDVWRDQYGIGIDTGAKTILYHKQKNGQENTVLLELSELKRCRISKEDDRIKTPGGDRRITTRIDLQIEFFSPEKTGVSVEFYNGENGESVRDEVILAEKWSKMINSRLTKK
jgi:hypothetical protein